MQTRARRVTFAGGTGRSVLAAASDALLPFFSTREAALALRLVCRELTAAVARHGWDDRKTVITGSIAAWRASFPRALTASVSMWANRPGGHRNVPVVDADFAHFAGLRLLDMDSCEAVTDAAFAHLKGIRTLLMVGCGQAGITDAAFAHLGGIAALNICRCNQVGITDAAFAHLKGIRMLDMRGCDQATITGSAFRHLAGAERVNMHGCTGAARDAARAAGLRVFD